jgi:hypothetical protein
MMRLKASARGGKPRGCQRAFSPTNEHPAVLDVGGYHFPCWVTFPSTGSLEL